MSRDLTRRAFVSGALAGAGLVCLLPAGCGLLGPDPRRVAEPLRRVIGRGRAAWELGEAFVAAAGDGRDGDAQRLASWLADRLGWTDDGFGADLVARYAAAVREDFQNGNHVGVEGWRLAATEARASALISLTIPKPDAELFELTLSL